MEPVIKIVSSETGGSITLNQDLAEHLIVTKSTERIIEAGKQGTPLFKTGSKGPQVLLTAGIHGNELPPQIAAFWLIDELYRLEGQKEMEGTVYIVPVAIPHATRNNSRRFQGWDMNRRAYKKGSISHTIVQMVREIKVDAVADFHSTQPQSNPGIEGVFCSKDPCYQSFQMAQHITKKTSSKIISQDQAGKLYRGAIEDECNLSGTPAITCEVVSYNGKVDKGSPERSYAQMKSFLEYFNIIQK